MNFKATFLIAFKEELEAKRQNTNKYIKTIIVTEPAANATTTRR